MAGLIARALRPTSTMMIWRGTLEAQEREVTSGTDLLTHCPSKGRDSGLARIAGAKGPKPVTNKEKTIIHTYKKSPHSASAREPKAPPSTPVKPNVRNPLRIPSGQAREAPYRPHTAPIRWPTPRRVRGAVSVSCRLGQNQGVPSLSIKSKGPFVNPR